MIPFFRETALGTHFSCCSATLRIAFCGENREICDHIAVNREVNAVVQCSHVAPTNGGDTCAHEIVVYQIDSAETVIEIDETVKPGTERIDLNIGNLSSFSPRGG
ncbi:hypothetical protein RF11_09510 [Thelohanellus kitauei]|uniref:Uncharacterized protein n=1 Tax=Thelohanellus kitauei TaxID=669202 RepID=A0A0C2MMT1_THEKT|nr:hypothetical protein RF11_09510 [Thelohanellus kitauei]